MTGDTQKAHLFLTGDDDAAFCQRVADALQNGYVLYGSPLLKVDEQGNRHCGQAVVLPEFASAKSAKKGLKN